MNNSTTELNKRLKVAEDLHYSIGDEIEFLHDQIKILNERLVAKQSDLANSHYEVTRIVKEKQTAGRFINA